MKPLLGPVYLLHGPDVTIPGPVYALARAKLFQYENAGATSPHWMDIDFGNAHYKFHVRKDHVGGGYRLILFQEGECVDKRGFLAVYDSDLDDPFFAAYYNDGLEENITPLDGKPRPDPETADRSRFVNLSKALRSPYDGGLTDDILYEPASKFTGLMREVVQCHHMRGLKGVFNPSWDTTHGILESPHPRVLGDTAAHERAKALGRKMWMIEISSLGVYATRITYGGRCCNSWEVPVFGSLTALTGLDLRAKYVALETEDPDQTRVLQLVDDTDMGNVYVNYGAPLTAETGWAFSYTGHEAQNVLFDPVPTTSDTETQEYTVRRVKLTFTVTDGVPSAALSVEEEITFTGWLYGIILAKPVTSDSSDDHFNYTLIKQTGQMPNSEESPVDDVEIPLYVYYTGDTEQICRVSNTDRSWTESFSAPTNPSLSGSASSYEIDLTFGVDYSGVTLDPGAVGSSVEESAVTVGLTFMGLTISEAAYDYNDTDIGLGYLFTFVVTSCDYTGPSGEFAHTEGDDNYVVQDTVHNNSFHLVRILVRIPHTDREALQITRTMNEQVGTWTEHLTYGTTPTYFDGFWADEASRDLWQSTTPPGAVFTEDCTSDTFTLEDEVAYAYDADGNYYLYIRAEDYFGTLDGIEYSDVLPLDYHSWLVEPGFNETSFAVPVYAMGGAIYYDDPTLSPTSGQYANAVYVLEPTEIDMGDPSEAIFEAYSVAVGGFDSPVLGIPRGFVGRI